MRHGIQKQHTQCSSARALRRAWLEVEGAAEASAQAAVLAAAVLAAH